MIAVLIFYIHTIFACYVFVKSYQTDGLLQAFLNLVFIIILFAVGWTISDLLVGFFISQNGYEISVPQNTLTLNLLKLTGFYIPGGNGMALLNPKDSISLIFLSLMEFFFFRFYFQKTKVAREI